MSTDTIAHSQRKKRAPGANRAEHGTQRHTYGKSEFQVSDDGVFFLPVAGEGDGNREFVCSRVDVVAKTRDSNSREWGRLLRWTDDDGTKHEWAMPMEVLLRDGVAVSCELARRGLTIAPGREARERLGQYLQTWPTQARARCVTRLGWHGGRYIMPNSETIGAEGELTVFQNVHAVEPAYTQQGTLAEWRTSVAALAQGNSRIVFCICAALAGALLEPAGMESGGYHWRGASSTGKSTALLCGASVCGSPEKFRREWRATSNGLEGTAAVHSDGVLVLDEIGQMSPHEIGECVYMLGNEMGKQRATQIGTARAPFTWRLLFLSAGEHSLKSLMSRANRKPTPGMELRLLEIEADAGKGMGIIEELHGCPDSKALVLALRSNATRCYGVVWPKWIARLVEHRNVLAEHVTNSIKLWTESLPPTASAQAQRAARRFGLVAVAGEMATEWELTGWPEGEAIAAADQCFRSWLSVYGGAEDEREERAVLEQVQRFFEMHGNSRFESIEGDSRIVQNRAGFYRLANDGTREYLVLPEVFRQEVIAGHDNAVKVLKKHDWLIHDKDGNATQKPRLPEMGPRRVYVLSAAAMGGHA